MAQYKFLKKAPDFEPVGTKTINVGGKWLPDKEAARVGGVPAFTELCGQTAVPVRLKAYGTTWHFGREVWINKAQGIYDHTNYYCEDRKALNEKFCREVNVSPEEI